VVVVFGYVLKVSECSRYQYQHPIGELQSYVGYGELTIIVIMWSV